MISACFQNLLENRKPFESDFFDPSSLQVEMVVNPHSNDVPIETC